MSRRYSALAILTRDVEDQHCYHPITMNTLTGQRVCLGGRLEVLVERDDAVDGSIDFVEVILLCRSRILLTRDSAAALVINVGKRLNAGLDPGSEDWLVRAKPVHGRPVSHKSLEIATADQLALDIQVVALLVGLTRFVVLLRLCHWRRWKQLDLAILLH